MLSFESLQGYSFCSATTTGVIIVPFDAFSKGLYNVEVTMQNSIERLSFIKTGK
jgi:hypothetical protein